jgi:predicted dithiol-disulfide oxidoreductase (DUF899 family)
VSSTQDERATGGVTYNYARWEIPNDDLPGTSVFYRDEAGEIFHTFSSYARGVDLLIGAYNYLDLVPKGRDEDDLAFSMAWVRHHDRYGDGYTVDPRATYQPPRLLDPCCGSEAS